MFTVEIRINGSLITHIYGHNEGTVPGGKDQYRYEVYHVEERALVNGTVKHHYGEGITKLVQLILKDADEKKKVPTVVDHRTRRHDIKRGKRAHPGVPVTGS